MKKILSVLLLFLAFAAPAQGVKQNILTIQSNGQTLSNIVASMASSQGTNSLIGTNAVFFTLTFSNVLAGLPTNTWQFKILPSVFRLAFNNAPLYSWLTNGDFALLSGVYYGDGSGLTNVGGFNTNAAIGGYTNLADPIIVGPVYSGLVSDPFVNGRMIINDDSGGRPFIVVAGDSAANHQWRSATTFKEFSISDGINAPVIDAYTYGVWPGNPVFAIAADGTYGQGGMIDPNSDNGGAPFHFSSSTNNLITTGSLFDIARGNTNKWSLKGNGDLYWGNSATVGWRPPTTNGTAGQALLTDGGTPQQLYYGTVGTGSGNGTVSNAAALTSGQFVIGQGAGGVATTLDANVLTNLNGTNLNNQGASAGQILTATATGVAFSNAPAAGGGGSVSNVAFTGPAGFTVTGSPITGSGTIALTAPSLVLTNGNTGNVQFVGAVSNNSAGGFVGNGGGLTNIQAAATNLGALTFATNAGNVSLINLPVSAASAGTVEAYSLQIAGTNMFTVTATADATTITNPIVTFPQANIVIYTNPLAAWPKAPIQAGACAIVGSNGTFFVLLSTNGAGTGSATWTSTNKWF